MVGQRPSSHRHPPGRAGRSPQQHGKQATRPGRGLHQVTGRPVVRRSTSSGTPERFFLKIFFFVFFFVFFCKLNRVFCFTHALPGSASKSSSDRYTTVRRRSPPCTPDFSHHEIESCDRQAVSSYSWTVQTLHSVSLLRANQVTTCRLKRHFDDFLMSMPLWNPELLEATRSHFAWKTSVFSNEHDEQSLRRKTKHAR